MCTVVATPGALDANSYVTLTEADAYMETRLHATTWPALTEDDKCRACLWATRLLDAWVEWDGRPATYTQRLAWPRWGLLTVTDEVIPETVLPDNLKAATVELAWSLTAGDVTATPDPVTGGLTAVTAGPVSLEFVGPSARQPVGDRIIPDAVWGLIQTWGRRRGAGLYARVVRV
jgi:hypothetical protein